MPQIALSHSPCSLSGYSQSKETCNNLMQGSAGHFSARLLLMAILRTFERIIFPACTQIRRCLEVLKKLVIPWQSSYQYFGSTLRRCFQISLCGVQDEFPGILRFACSVFPSDDDDVVTSPYNALLALNQLLEHADCVLPLENQALQEIATRVEVHTQCTSTPASHPALGFFNTLLITMRSDMQ